MTKKLLCVVLASLVTSGLLAAGCATSSPPPEPTKTTAAPTPAAEPTRAAPDPGKQQSQPTAAPAPKVDYPQKGRAIMVVVPYAAGGTSDISVRIIAPALEKELGVPLEIVNKAGASTQVGLTEVAKSKPDGYTLGNSSLPANIPTYLDPQRKAAFGRKDLQPVANFTKTPQVIAVLANSPYKTLKDLVDAAKAKPEQVKVSDAGIGSIAHMATLTMAKVANVKFATVHFNSGGQALTALLGEHVDAQSVGIPTVLSQAKSGAVRVLAQLTDKRDPSLSDVPTAAEQGYDAYMDSYYGWVFPVGVPKEIVQTVSLATKKVLDAPDIRQKMIDGGQPPNYLDTPEFTATWNRQEEIVKAILPDMAQ